jgi:hypothetical protein
MNLRMEFQSAKNSRLMVSWPKPAYSVNSTKYFALHGLAASLFCVNRQNTIAVRHVVNVMAMSPADSRAATLHNVAIIRYGLGTHKALRILFWMRLVIRWP